MKHQKLNEFCRSETIPRERAQWLEMRRRRRSSHLRRTLGRRRYGGTCESIRKRIHNPSEVRTNGFLDFQQIWTNVPFDIEICPKKSLSHSSQNYQVCGQGKGGICNSIQRRRHARSCWQLHWWVRWLFCDWHKSISRVRTNTLNLVTTLLFQPYINYSVSWVRINTINLVSNLSAQPFRIFPFFSVTKTHSFKRIMSFRTGGAGSRRSGCVRSRIRASDLERVWISRHKKC